MRKLAWKLLFLGFGLLSCGSTRDLAQPNQVECGPGTRLEGGRCVVDDAGTGEGSGGASGGGHAGAGGTAPGGAGGEGGTPGGGAGSSGEAGTAGSAGHQGPGPDDDPCPLDGLPMDCSGQCDEISPRCEMATCRPEGPYGVTVKEDDEFPYIFRTPSKPGFDPACEEVCSEPPVTAYGVGVGVLAKEDQTKDFKVTVGPPWRIIVHSTSHMKENHCIYPGAPYECTIGYLNSWMTFVVATDDPNAPARNVTIERVNKPGSCP